jgi:hypothetical protein
MNKFKAIIGFINLLWRVVDAVKAAIKAMPTDLLR